MYRKELDAAFQAWIRGPGEHLSVFDNFRDLADCRQRTGANATVAWANPPTTEAARFHFPDDVAGKEDVRAALSADAAGRLLSEEQTFGTTVLGDHNNPWFPFFPEDWLSKYPDAFMQDVNGAVILLHDTTRREGRGIPMPALDALPILEYSSRCIRAGAKRLAAHPLVSAWVLGSEESYPEYFQLPQGDFRPDFLRHFAEWLGREGVAFPVPNEEILRRDPFRSWILWLRFREQAMADRAAWHMRDFLSADGSRPVFYPTHGSPFCADFRWRLGQPAAMAAGVCDGLEMGHIPVDDDDERINPLALAHFSSFGAPVMVPRLGNRTVDFQARGLGRSFTPEMLRRLVYECLGYGAWHIGPIHWSSVLHDGEWFIRDTPAEAACRQVFREILDAAPILRGMARLQPGAALYVSDEEWLHRWNPAWTGFFQDALRNHLHCAIVTDAVLKDLLPDRIPVLACLEARRLSTESLEQLTRYVDAGGRVAVHGGFAERDEQDRPILPERTAAFLGHSGVEVVEAPAKPEERVLVNEFLSHTEGSFQVVHQYAAAPFHAIAGAMARMAPRARIRPVTIEYETPHETQVDAYPLTDGVSLLCVLVNVTERFAALKVRPSPPTDGDEGDGFVFFDVVRRQRMGEGPEIQVRIGRHGTCLLWMVPKRVLEDPGSLERARSALSGWKALGCDLAVLSPLSEALDSTDLAGLDALAEAKRTVSARSLLDSLVLRAEVEARLDGGIGIRAVAYRSDLRPAADAHVTLRCIPDTFRRRSLHPAGDGNFRIEIPKEDLPSFYDPVRKNYGPWEGPLRFILSASTPDGASGGAMALIELG